MGNRSNIDQWATVERMRFIERSAYWRGTINRQDLARVFGLSMAQASADLQKYQEVNPGALAYNLNQKRYEGTAALVPQFHVPALEEALAIFIDGGAVAGRVAAGKGRAVSVAAAGVRATKSEEKATVLSEAAPGREAVSETSGDVVDVLAMPLRRADPEVERCLFQAVLHRLRIRVRYLSVKSGTDGWRWLRPRAFAHNDSRWHVRAWCEKNGEWRDFTLARFKAVDRPQKGDPPPVEDVAWNTWTTLRLRPHGGLDEAQRQAVELDYAMKDGVLEMTVRLAMADYVRSRLHVPLSSGKKAPPLLEPVDETPAEADPVTGED